MILWVPLDWAMDKKSIARFKKLLQARQKELQHGLSQRHREERRVEPDKEEGDRATTPQSRELLFRQDSRDRILSLPQMRLWVESKRARSASASTADRTSIQGVSRPFRGFATASRANS